MKAETTRRIMRAADTLGLELRLHEGYSGRHMHGDSCAAVSGSESDIQQAVVYAAYQIGRESGLAAADVDDGDDYVEDVGSLRWDNLGHSRIAY